MGELRAASALFGLASAPVIEWNLRRRHSPSRRARSIMESRPPV